LKARLPLVSLCALITRDLAVMVMLWLMSRSHIDERLAVRIS
jgi:hypothetical protein